MRRSFLSSIRALISRCLVRSAAWGMLGIGFRREQSVLRRAVQLARMEAVKAPLVFAEAVPTPLISIVVPVYNTPVSYLDDLLESFEQQNQALCELVLSDDASTSPSTLMWLRQNTNRARLRVLFAEKNGGIAKATNAGIAVANGTWVTFLDHDDMIAPYAVEQLARALLSHPNCQFLYTDEVVTNGWLLPIGNFLKPAWDNVLLSGMNYINHFAVYRRDRLLELGCLREGFEGSQDYELLLRYTKALCADTILHLPYPAYIWRRDGKSYSSRFLAAATLNARRALAERYADAAGQARITEALNNDLHRVDFSAARERWPLVSVVIPSRNAFALISQLLHGITAKTDYPAMEIIIVDNGTTDLDVIRLYGDYREGPVPFHLEMQAEAFNFSRAVNKGIARAKGDYILLLNNDVEIEDSGWLREMVSCFDFEDVGIVGAKLLYPDRTLQHAGVIVGLGGLAGHWFIGKKSHFPGPMGRLKVRQSLNAVTGACFMISRRCRDAVGEFDAESFAIAYNDVDYCLRAVDKGYRVVFTPFAELLHHESASRGSDETPENIMRFRSEQDNLRRRYQTDIYEDRALNPWYGKGRSDPRYSLLTALPQAR